MQAGIGYVPEDRLEQGLFMKKSVGENIVAVIINRLLGKWNLIDPEKWDETVNTWINDLDIKVVGPDVAVQTLSGGNQQRVVC